MSLEGFRGEPIGHVCGFKYILFFFCIILVFLAPAPQRACLQPPISSPNTRRYNLLMRNSACYVTPYANNIPRFA